MYDYRKLRGLIREHCGTQKEFAKRLGIGTTALSSRLNNRTPFTQDEIMQSWEIFGLASAKELDQVFFIKK